MVFCIRSKQLLCVCCALCALSATLSAAASLEQADVAAALGIGMKYVFQQLTTTVHLLSDVWRRNTDPRTRVFNIFLFGGSKIINNNPPGQPQSIKFP